MVLLLTFIIHLLTTLSYAVRTVGIETRRVTLTFSLFNILLLVSRTANGFQAPLLAHIVEKDLQQGIYSHESLFRQLLLASTLATLVGMLLLPSFQRLLAHAVWAYMRYASLGKMLRQCFSTKAYRLFKGIWVWPKVEGYLPNITAFSAISWKIFLLHSIATAIITTGVLSAVYAAYFNPNFRTTASNLSAFINGISTIVMVVFIDPYLSVMTDEVLLGKCSLAHFKQELFYTLVARLVGTVLAQALFMPSAVLLAELASYL